MTKTEERIINGKKLVVFDGITSFDFRQGAYGFIKNSTYKIGFEDTAYSNYPYICSGFTNQDVVNMGVWRELKDKPPLELVSQANLERAIVNLTIPNEPHWCHTHTNQTVMLYYANPEWKEEWGGETLFMNDDQTDIEFASIYKPGRIVVFDGGIPHTIRSPSILAPTYRFTLSMFFRGSLPRMED